MQSLPVNAIVGVGTKEGPRLHNWTKDCSIFLSVRLTGWYLYGLCIGSEVKVELFVVGLVVINPTREYFLRHDISNVFFNLHVRSSSLDKM